MFSAIASSRGSHASSFFLVSSLLTISLTLSAQVPGVDNATIAKIRGEAMTQSQAMDTHWWLSEGFGARATGTPGYEAAADWAMKKFNEWGLKNVHVERFPFGQGWSIDRFSVHLLTPQPAVLVGQPRWYSPSTKGTVTVGRRSREGSHRSRPREIQGSAGRQDRDPAGGACRCACSKIASS